MYQAIKAIQLSEFKHFQVMIYSGAEKTPQEILAHIKDRFGMDISAKNLTFIKLSTANRLKPENYPTFTIFWQALAMVRVCFEALRIAPCDVFIDTMGVGYAYPFVKLFFGPKIYSYTHYPIVR